MARDKETLLKNELIREISNHANVKEEIVRIVYESFIDVAMAEIANKGKFEINEIMKINSVEVNSNLTESGTTLRMSTKISQNLRRLAKLIHRGDVEKVTPATVKEKVRVNRLNYGATTMVKPKELSIDDLLSDEEY